MEANLKALIDSRVELVVNQLDYLIAVLQDYTESAVKVLTSTDRYKTEYAMIEAVLDCVTLQGPPLLIVGVIDELFMSQQYNYIQNEIFQLYGYNINDTIDIILDEHINFINNHGLRQNGLL